MARTTLRGLLIAASALLFTASAVAQPALQQQQQRPNVLVWMMDDVGFAQVSAYGGLVATPNIDRVAKMGLRYTNYHTAPICSAARASFLTGRMPHSVHIGGHSTAARDLPGYDAKIPPSAGTIAENLRQAGYATASPAGPFTYWATGQGFEHFYGFLAADADNWNPMLLRDRTPVPKPAGANYHLNADLADEAISLIRARDPLDPKRPFFFYWATGAAHAPHHAPPEWLAKYRGKFDMGWDKAREAILKTEKAQGLVPKSAQLAPVPAEMPPWDALSADQKKLFARQMETFAASLSYADAQFGRILDALEARGELDNTIILITSDNGASAEGGPEGLYNEALVTGGKPPTTAENMAFYDDWGGPRTYPHYAYGWAVAGNTPFRYYKQTTHEGGTRVPLIIAWPKGIKAHGELRGQFVHVSDLTPTILAAAGVAPAAAVNNVPQSPMEGQSIAASFDNAKYPGHGRAQYVELYGNKGLWWQNWVILTTHRTRTWDFRVAKTFDEPWELYDLANDPGQAHDLAAKYPERMQQMAAIYEDQAKRYHVAPQHNLNDTAAESMARAQANFERRGKKWSYGGPVSNIPQALAPPITTRNFRMTATLDLARGDITGPLFAYGGQLGGIGLYLDKGKPIFIANSLGGVSVRAGAEQALGTGLHKLELVVVKSAPAQYQVTISADGKLLTAQQINYAMPFFFGISETFGVGNDDGSPVLAGTAAGYPIAARLSDVVFDFNGLNKADEKPASFAH